MKRSTLFFAIAIALAVVFSSCENNDSITDVIDFEDLTLDQSGVWNGSDGSGDLTVGNATFPNSYNATWDAWNGFAISNHTDTETAGYANQYSAIAGSGADGSEKYAVFYTFSSDTIRFSVPEIVNRISVCNSTYAYLSMLNGDAVARQFGGEDGTDPDYFKLIIKALDATNQVIATVNVMLADFTSDNSAEDYISNAWTDINMSEAGRISALVLSFESSDVGQYGMNTPAYVCIDNIEGELAE